MRAPATWLFFFAIVAGGCQGRSRTDESRPVDAGPAPIARAAEAGGGECRDDTGCASDRYCEFSPGLCGKGKRPGTCRPRPQACDETYAPVCGCDGLAYPNECAAHAAGVDLAVMGRCKERFANFAPCGRHYCDVRTSYCEIFLSDVFELPTDYFCRPLPPSCVATDGGARGCDCFPAGTRCGSFCGPLPTAPGARTGFHLTCQGTRQPTE